MALVVNDEVALTLNLNTVGGSNGILEQRSSAPTFGIVIATGGGPTVLWENGLVSGPMIEAALDQINGVADATQPVVTTYSGKLFALATASSIDADAEYRVAVVRIYQRLKAGETGPALVMALCMFIDTGEFFETAATNLVPTQGYS